MRWAIWTVGLILGAAGAQAASGNHAIRVIDYEPGLDPGAYTNATAALGSPSRQTDDPHPQWGGIWPVDPFSAPYLPYQIVEIGSGGQLTLAFEHPVLNDPTHPYGIDLLVFGNAFFQLNPDWTTANGQLGGTNEGLTVVSVSADGQRFFRLDPERSALIDSWHPTDGQGDFARPVNPVLGPADFAGLELEGIRRLYDGSGGGTGLKLDHAVDEHGEPVVLPWIRFVRFEQASGRAQVDAVSGVAPRPTLFNDFNHPPTAANWRVAGDASLFQWDNTAGTLQVTWDSSRPNSYFYQPLGTVLSRTDDFVLGFDLRLDSIQPGTTPGKPYAFQIAIGLVDLDSVLDPAFVRGTGSGPRNVLEFDYFPDAGFGATVSPVMISRDRQYAAGFEFPLILPEEQWVRVLMRFSAADATLRTQLLQDNQVLYSIQDVVLGPEFTDFRFNAVAVCSYSDEGQAEGWGGSVYAHGAVDHLLVVLPDLPVTVVHGGWTNGAWSVELITQPSWNYTLERMTGLRQWSPVATLTATARDRVTLQDPAPEISAGFYRVRAVKP